ncbi:Protein of unknown function [Evansella caseinilytica]|uniref:DUF2507 domain-containing protein n=1 Tax=Evansella caseinilytica TaxID=1503961 RepID=A0A1H3TTU8_9BACI|nr:DUF2507 domain-containing protein [Evansella caseinilytica]SDZ53388.1 Protein of unknown function [Evansella caseinilytica]
MRKSKRRWLQTIEDTDNQVSAYSNYLLRHALLPELLGEEEEAVLYWAGKAIARKVAEVEPEELPFFFEKANWGSLQLVKEKGTEKHYELTAPFMHQDRPFTLESGFLSQWTENQTGFTTEANCEVIKKKPCICRIIVRWDPKDPVPHKKE